MVRKIISLLLVSMLFLFGCASNQASTSKIQFGKMNLSTCKVIATDLINKSTDFEEYVPVYPEFDFMYIENEPSVKNAALIIDEDLSNKKLPETLSFTIDNYTLVQTEGLKPEVFAEVFPKTGIEKIDTYIQNGKVEKTIVKYKNNDVDCLLAISLTIFDKDITENTVNEINDLLIESENFSQLEKQQATKTGYVYKDTKETFAVSYFEENKLVIDYTVVINY